MATIKIWKGDRRGGLDEFVKYEEFEGETIGACREENDARGVYTTFYRVADGRIVAHVVWRSRGEDEAEYAYIYVFPALDGVNGATAVFWRELAQAGLISSLRFSRRKE